MLEKKCGNTVRGGVAIQRGVWQYSGGVARRRIVVWSLPVPSISLATTQLPSTLLHQLIPSLNSTMHAIHQPHTVVHDNALKSTRDGGSRKRQRVVDDEDDLSCPKAKRSYSASNPSIALLKPVTSHRALEIHHDKHMCMHDDERIDEWYEHVLTKPANVNHPIHDTPMMHLVEDILWPSTDADVHRLKPDHVDTAIHPWIDARLQDDEEPCLVLYPLHPKSGLCLNFTMDEDHDYHRDIHYTHPHVLEDFVPIQVATLDRHMADDHIRALMMDVHRRCTSMLHASFNATVCHKAALVYLIHPHHSHLGMLVPKVLFDAHYQLHVDRTTSVRTMLTPLRKCICQTQ